MFVKSFLSSYASRTGALKRIGLYTNPYSPNIREPIKINSKPVSVDKFTTYFFEVWEILSSKFSDTMMPDYMQLRLLVAMYIFMAEDVQIVIMETHCGGETNATDFVKPTAVGIAQVHADPLENGPSLEDLAWHAGGVLKPDIPAYSIPQDHEARQVLEKHANEKGVVLNFVAQDYRLPVTAHALKTDMKRFECSVALSLTDAYLTSLCNEKYPFLSSEDISIGLDRYFWPGRYQRLDVGQNAWFLDGAHHLQTVPIAAEWFAMSVCEEATLSPFSYALRRMKQAILNKEEPRNPKVVVFGHKAKVDGEKVVESLAMALEKHRCKVRHVIFTTDWDDCGCFFSFRIICALGYTNVSIAASKITDSDISAMRSYAHAWQRLSPNSSILLEPNNAAAIDLATKIGYQNHAMECLVTGSLYLTGCALRHLDPTAEKV